MYDVLLVLRSGTWSGSQRFDVPSELLKFSELTRPVSRTRLARCVGASARACLSFPWLPMNCPGQKGNPQLFHLSSPNPLSMIDQLTVISWPAYRPDPMRPPCQCSTPLRRNLRYGPLSKVISLARSLFSLINNNLTVLSQPTNFTTFLCLALRDQTTV